MSEKLKSFVKYFENINTGTIIVMDICLLFNFLFSPMTVSTIAASIGLVICANIAFNALSKKFNIQMRDDNKFMFRLINCFLISSVIMILNCYFITYLSEFTRLITLNSTTLNVLCSHYWYIMLAVVIVYCFLSIVFNMRIAIIISTVITTIVYSVNFVVYSILTRYVIYDDLNYAATAVGFGKDYTLTSGQIIHIVVFTVIGILNCIYVFKTYKLLTTRYKDSVKLTHKMFTVRIFSVIILCCALYLDVSVNAVHDQGYISEPAHYFLYSYIHSIRNYDMSDSEKYIADYTTDTDIESEIKPNIIFILNESYSDLDYSMSTDENADHYKIINDIKAKSVSSGFTYFDEIGTGTVNTEFSVLSGMATGITTRGGTIYNSYYKNSIVSVPACLKDLGYKAYCFKSADLTYYNCKHALAMYDFDEIIPYYESLKADPDFKDADGWDEMYDHYFYNNALNRLKETNEPVFEYVITIQNHGPYTDDDVDQFKVYMDRFDSTSQQLEEFIEKVDNLDEPTIVLFFGDHLPSIPSEFSKRFGEDYNTKTNPQYTKLHQTPYFIYANYDTGYDKVSDDITSMNYLAAKVFNIAGIRNEWYDDVYKLQDQYPVISAGALYDSEMNDLNTQMDITRYYQSSESTEEYKKYFYNSITMLTNKREKETDN